MRTFEEECNLRNKPVQMSTYIYSEVKPKWIGMGFASPRDPESELMRLENGPDLNDSMSCHAVKCSRSGKVGILIHNGGCAQVLLAIYFEDNIIWKHYSHRPESWELDKIRSNLNMLINFCKEKGI